MTSFAVLSAHDNDASAWQAAWEKLPDELRDVMFTPAYARVQEASGQGTAYCARYAWEKFVVLQPFILRDAGNGKSDITTFYGGGGPVTNMKGWSVRALWEWFDRDFAKWRTQHGIVCEYAQLHLATFPNALDMLGIKDATPSKESVLIRLGTDDEMLREFSDTRVATLARGRRDGLRCERIGLPGQSVEYFYSLYTEAMKRKGAHNRWMLPKEYFTAHFAELGESAAMMAVSDPTGFVVTMAIVLTGGEHASFHFAASVEKPPQGASDLIIFESAKIAREAGCKYLVLGGGVTSKPDDSLLWFKSGFSHLRKPVYVVKRIFDQVAYDELCAAVKAPESETYFPKYRSAA